MGQKPHLVAGLVTAHWPNIELKSRIVEVEFPRSIHFRESIVFKKEAASRYRIWIGEGRAHDELSALHTRNGIRRIAPVRLADSQGCPHPVAVAHILQGFYRL